MDRRKLLMATALAALAVLPASDAERKAEKRRKERDIRITRVAEPNRRRDCLADPYLFLPTYFGSIFYQPFTPDRREMIDAIRHATRYGGDQAVAGPRADGKTRAALFVTLEEELGGWLTFPLIISKSGPRAARELKNLKSAIEGAIRDNGPFAQDFPEICEPIKRLERWASKARQQTAYGLHTEMEWGEECIIFPTIPSKVLWENGWNDDIESAARGQITASLGIEGPIRGYSVRNVRPDIAILDDIDDRESANSQLQTENRERIIEEDVGGLAGPDKTIARVMLCTLLNRTCIAARFTDRSVKPSWRGQRHKLLAKLPTDEALWSEYIAMRQGRDPSDPDARVAHKFLLDRYEAMHEGAEVTNPYRFDQRLLLDGKPAEVSALQACYNLIADRGWEHFNTEYQNDPKDDAANETLLSRAEIASKVNGYERGTVPSDAAHLSAFIDVQGTLLYWAVVAWTPDFTGYVVDYGAWPKQGRSYFTLADAAPTITSVLQGGREAQIYGALTECTNLLLGREWPVDGGQTMKVGRCLIDANWGESTPTVYSFCRQSAHAAVLIPSHGRGIKASGSPIMLWPKQDGEQVGLNWRIRRTTKKHAPIRHALYDTNYWKSFLHARLFVPMGGKGSLSLFKADPATHRMVADQLHAEYPVAVESQGRKVHEWQERPNHPDNHLLDCLTGCCVVGSMLGANLDVMAKPQRKKSMTLEEMRKRAGR